MSASPVNFYCYYRVDPMRSDPARAAVAHIFRILEERVGAVGRLFKDERDPTLWMEVYEQVREPDRFEAQLAELGDSQGFAAFLAPGSMRRIERFVAL